MLNRAAPTMLELKRRLVAGGYLHVLSASVMLQLLGFGSVMLVARLVSAPDLADIRTAQAYAAVAVILAGAGLSSPILLYCADPDLSEAQKRRLIRYAVRTTVFVGGLIASICVALTLVLNGPTDTAAKVQAIYALALPGLALTSLLFVYMQSRQQFAQLARSQTLIKGVSVAVVVVATWLFGVAGFLVGTVVTVYAGLIPLLRPLRRNAVDDTAAPALPPDLWARASYGMAGTFVTMLGQSSDFMLMDFTNVARDDVGRYALASAFAAAAVSLTGVIQTVLTPRFTALRGDSAGFRRELATWSLRMPLISIGVALAALAGASVLSRWFFGAAYSGFTTYLAVLLGRYVIWSNFAVVGAALAGMGVVRSGVAIALATTILSFAIGLPLCKEFGAFGAAWAQVLVACFSLVAIWLVGRWEMRRAFERPS